ncbi:MAG: hypothetical protein ACP5H9_02765 [Candidatus Woesearchaeota archaeon]
MLKWLKQVAYKVFVFGFYKTKKRRKARIKKFCKVYLLQQFLTITF